MKAEDCPNINTCYKVKMVLDKDFPADAFYVVLIREVCALCESKKEGA